VSYEPKIVVDRTWRITRTTWKTLNNKPRRRYILVTHPNNNFIKKKIVWNLSILQNKSKPFVEFFLGE
jgi:hypothetical protein